jgi:hypothetical protein
MKEYAVYRGDNFEFMGTTKEICAKYGVKPDTVWFWNSKANKERVEARKSKKRKGTRGRPITDGIIAIVVDYKEEEDECYLE